MLEMSFKILENIEIDAPGIANVELSIGRIRGSAFFVNVVLECRSK